MAKNKESKGASGIEDPSGQAGQRSGNPRRQAHHEGQAGEGEMRDLGGRKWNKEGRDSASEKEPGKSRGPGAGEERVPQRLTREQLPP